MSFDKLVGPTVHLVVYIKEGQGFGFLTTPVMITSSLLNHVLATDVELPSPEPHFNYELTYEINKKLVKRLRVDNTSMKIDCYSMTSGRKDRIGYILLNLKELQIVLQEGKTTEAWHRLLGLNKEARMLGPQLLLSFYVTDIPKDGPVYCEIQQNPPMWKKSLHGVSLPIYVKEDESLIQIGPDKICTNRFILTLSVAAAYNIIQLIDDNVDADLCVVYTLLGFTVRTKPVQRVNNTYQLDEKIVIHLRSSLKYLSELTELLKVDLKLMCGNNEIGTTSFLLEDLTKNLKKVVEKQCVMVSPKLDVNSMTDLQPLLEVAVYFAKESRPVKKTMDLRTIESHRPRDEDGKKWNRPETLLDQKRQTTSLPSIKLNLASLDNPCPETVPAGSTYRAQKDEGSLQNYVLTVVLDSVQLSQKPNSGNIFFRFHHPEAVIKTLSDTEVNVDDFVPVKARFHFKLPASIHQNYLTSRPPKITVSSEEEEEIASVLLHFGILFSSNQKTCSYTAVLENDKDNRGLVGITMTLEEVDKQLQAHSPIIEEIFRTPIAADNQLMLKVVEELEDWKEKQEEIFKAELLRKEREHMAKLSAEWEEKKCQMEEALLFNVENSQTVLDSLNTATENLRLRELKLKEKEMKLQHDKEELKRKYTAKLQELRIASHRVKDEQSLKASVAIAEQVGEFEKLIQKIEKEKRDLEAKVHILEKECAKHKEDFLSKEQADTIYEDIASLTQKFEKEQQSKIYYKTEWGKAVREQHRLQKMYNDILKQYIEKNNEETHILSIQQIAADHDKALQQDQLWLLDLKNQILSWRKGQGDSARSAGSKQSGFQLCPKYAKSEDLPSADESKNFNPLLQ